MDKLATFVFVKTRLLQEQYYYALFFIPLPHKFIEQYNGNNHRTHNTLFRYRTGRSHSADDAWRNNRKDKQRDARLCIGRDGGGQFLVIAAACA